MKLSFVVALMMALGWLSHWLISVRKARASAVAAKTTPPTMLQYWTADWPTTALSIIGVLVVYFGAPYMIETFPDAAAFMGAKAGEPLNPLTSFLLGLFAPWIADFAGKRVAKMVGD